MSDTSGSLSTSSYNGRYLTFSWSLSGQDVGGNKSTISWRLYGDGPEWVEDGVTWYYCRNVELKIDGSVVYSSGSDSPVELRSGTEVASGSYTLSHQSDGTKAFDVNIQAALYSWSVNVSGYTEWRLPDIARASQPSINSYPNNTPDFNLGDTITIHMNRASSAFTHNVYFCWDNQYIIVATGVTDNCTFNTNSSQTVHGSDGKTYTISSVKQNYLQYTPNDTKKSGYIAVDTYNSSTNLGRKTCPFTAHFVNVPPKINSVMITDDNAGVTYPGGKLSAIEGGKYIQGYSRVRFKVSAGSDYGASIKQWTITLSGASATGLGDGVYTNLGNGKWSVTAVDSRGNTASTSGTISVLQYKQLTLDVAGLTRSDSDGTKALINVSGSWHNGSLGAVNNVLTLSYSGTNSGNLTPATSGNTYKVSSTQIAGTYATSSTYGITLKVQDKLSTITRSLTIYEMLPVVAYFKTHFDVFGDLHIHDRNNESTYGIISASKAQSLMFSTGESGTIDDLYKSRRNTPGGAGSVQLTQKTSGVGSEISGGWYNYIYMPHRIGGPVRDNGSYGTILLFPMTWSGTSYIVRCSNTTSTVTEVKAINFGKVDDLNTYNVTDTWIPVLNNEKLQHTDPNAILRLGWGSHHRTISPTYTNCSPGDYNWYYQFGQIMICCINLHLGTGVRTGTRLISGLPPAIHTIPGSLASSTNDCIAIYVDTNGYICMDGSGQYVPADAYYNGTLVYQTKSIY